jgi:DNA processing protein
VLSDDAAAVIVLAEKLPRRRLARLLETHPEPLALLRERNRFWRGRIRQVRKLCEDLSISAATLGENSYPQSLRQIPDPPLLLYHRGELSCYEQPAVAIVGARRASRLGCEVAGTLAATLAAAGVNIVSGLALGVDSAAHRGALQATSGGITLAALGSGLGCIAPITNTRLAESIVASGGLLVSEYPPMMQARPYHFPERNRIISGLADAVVVVEASERSGSLITARLALEQGREVLAVPGAVSAANSRGVNALLKQGAGLVDSAQDVLDVLTARGAEISSSAPRDDPILARLSPAAASLLENFRDAALSFDELSRSSHVSVADLNALLAELELAGFVARTSGGYIRRPFK